MTKLMPCPFCGRQVTRHVRRYDHDGWCNEVEVYCDCGAEIKISVGTIYADGTPYRFLPTAIDKWNTRNGLYKKGDPNDD